VVERLVHPSTLYETAVEVADEFDRIGNTQGGMAAEEIADGDIGRTPQRLMCETGQVFVEE
jgi:hypothetical protein